MIGATDRRGAALAVLCAMALMIVLDSTIVAVAIPAIQHDLGFSEAGVAWVVNGYLVAFAGLLLLSGRLGDLLGAWRVLLAGLAVFTLASVLCGFAWTGGLLVAGRFVQGAGGALASAVVLGMIVRLYPAPGEQARAMGIYSFVQAGGAAVGFVLGGVLTDTLGWAWIFLINVPVGVLVGFFALRVLPREAGVRRGGVDVPGALLITAGLSMGVYAIVRTTEGPGAWLLGAGASLLIAGFLVRQRLAARPLIPLRLLARPWLLITNAAVVLIFAAGLGFQFVNTLYLQRVMGFDPLATGLAFIPTPVVIGVVSLVVAPRVTARFGPRRVLIAGLALLMTGLAMLGFSTAGLSYLTGMLPALVVIGLGVGVTIPAVIMLAMADAAPSDTGMVSGVNNTAQQAGAALGLAVLASVAAAVTGSTVTVDSLRAGYSAAFLVTAAFVAAALLITVFAVRRPPATRPSPWRGPDLSAAGARSAPAGSRSGWNPCGAPRRSPRRRPRYGGTTVPPECT
jgi:MFS family permease